MHKEIYLKYFGEMSLVFSGSHTTFHRQCFKMAETMTHHFEQNMCGLNLHARPHVPAEQEDAEKNNDSRDEGSAANDASEEKNDIELK